MTDSRPIIEIQRLSKAFGYLPDDNSAGTAKNKGESTQDFGQVLLLPA